MDAEGTIVGARRLEVSVLRMVGGVSVMLLNDLGYISGRHRSDGVREWGVEPRRTTVSASGGEGGRRKCPGALGGLRDTEVSDGQRAVVGVDQSKDTCVG